MLCDEVRYLEASDLRELRTLAAGPLDSATTSFRFYRFCGLGVRSRLERCLASELWIFGGGEANFALADADLCSR